MTRLVVGITVVMVVTSAIVYFTHASLILLFIASCLSIVPLAFLMGRSTESIGAYAGPRIGGLLSATFGNAVELIIGIMALMNGLTELVKASITGSILGNLLLVLGLSFTVGGIRHPIQHFNVRAARSNASMLVLGVGLAFAIPAIFDSATSQAGFVMSKAVTVVSLSVYVLGLLFSLFTHRKLFESIESVANTETNRPHSQKLSSAILLLFASTVFVGIESEWLVKSISVIGRNLGLGELFMGVIVIAIVGNAAEHASAVWMAWKNRMDLSLEIAIGSSLQVAMFVAPVLFVVSLLVGHPMSLVFSLPELASMAAAVALIVVLMVDGESNWLEGIMAVGAYVLIAVGFYTLSAA